MKVQNLKTLSIVPSKLIAARGQMALSEAARELGISPQHLYRIESGGQRCPAHIFVRMLILYKISDPLSLVGQQKFLAAA